MSAPQSLASLEMACTDRAQQRLELDRICLRRPAPSYRAVHIVDGEQKGIEEVWTLFHFRPWDIERSVRHAKTQRRLSFAPDDGRVLQAFMHHVFDASETRALRRDAAVEHMNRSCQLGTHAV